MLLFSLPRLGGGGGGGGCVQSHPAYGPVYSGAKERSTTEDVESLQVRPVILER